MKLINDVNCQVYGTRLAGAGTLVTLISILGKMAIVSDGDSRFSCRYAELTCPLTPENFKPLQPTPPDPVKAKKIIINRSKDQKIQKPQTTLFD